MLYQNYSFEQSQNQIFSVLKELQIAKLLYKANIRKGCGLSAFEMFQRLVMLVFHGKNLFRSLESKHNDCLAEAYLQEQGHCACPRRFGVAAQPQQSRGTPRKGV